jgi:HSP20 family protein
MSFIRFYNPGVPCYRDENANEAYEGLIRRFSTGQYGCNKGNIPASNISETDKEYTISMALPGVEKKDIQIQHEKGYLTIRIVKTGEVKENEEYSYREFDYSGASRTYRTGDKIDTENITAGYENGILTIHLPKKEVPAEKTVQTISVE